MKNTTIFERILQIIEFYNIKSVNSFAKDYLKYDSSEKINRLKDGTQRPSFEILEDITNKFEDIESCCVQCYRCPKNCNTFFC